jgi:hypothetical protein
MRRLSRFAAPAAAAAVLFAALLCFPPTEYTFWPRCQLHEMTGLHCPGCGFTRGLYSLLKGDLAASLSWNLLLIPSLAAAGAMLLLRNRPVPLRRLAVIYLAIMICYGVLRNLPWHPFTLLVPGGW